VPSP